MGMTCCGYYGVPRVFFFPPMTKVTKHENELEMNTIEIQFVLPCRVLLLVWFGSALIFQRMFFDPVFSS